MNLIILNIIFNNFYFIYFKIKMIIAPDLNQTINQINSSILSTSSSLSSTSNIDHSQMNLLLFNTIQEILKSKSELQITNSTSSSSTSSLNSKNKIKDLEQTNEDNEQENVHFLFYFILFYFI